MSVVNRTSPVCLFCGIEQSRHGRARLGGKVHKLYIIVAKSKQTNKKAQKSYSGVHTRVKNGPPADSDGIHGGTYDWGVKRHFCQFAFISGALLSSKNLDFEQPPRFDLLVQQRTQNLKPCSNTPLFLTRQLVPSLGPVITAQFESRTSVCIISIKIKISHPNPQNLSQITQSPSKRFKRNKNVFFFSSRGLQYCGR